jgi:hypothetical protein
MNTSFSPKNCFLIDEPGTDAGGGVGLATPPQQEPTGQTQNGQPLGDNRSLEEQNKILQMTLQKERENAKLAEQRAKQALQESNQYKASLGELSPERLAEINEAMDRSAKWEAELSRVRGETARVKDEEYSTQVRELESQVKASRENLYTLEKRLAIQDWFDKDEVKGRAAELQNLIQLAGDRFEYDVEKKKIVKVLDLNGKEMFVNGNPATPQDLMLEMRQGKYGSALAGCFIPYNQSSGGGLPLTGANGQPVHNMEHMSPSERLTLAFNQKP